jgi:hypothetical protein
MIWSHLHLKIVLVLGKILRHGDEFVPDIVSNEKRPKPRIGTLQVHEEFQPRTMWSLSNAFTSAFKELDPIPQYKATARLAGFLQAVRPS